jgi:hypothetical protein
VRTPSKMLAMIDVIIARKSSAKTGGAGVQDTRKHSEKFLRFLREFG